MPKHDYSKNRATAARLIDKFGQAGTLRQAPSPDPLEPYARPTGPATLTAITFLDLDIKVGTETGSAVQNTIRTLLVSVGTDTATINQGDDVAIGVTVDDVDVETVWTAVAKSRPLAVSGYRVLYELDMED